MADDRCLDLFESIQNAKATLKISHFELSQSPLKEVFERVIDLASKKG